MIDPIRYTAWEWMGGACFAVAIALLVPFVLSVVGPSRGESMSKGWAGVNAAAAITLATIGALIFHHLH